MVKPLEYETIEVVDDIRDVMNNLGIRRNSIPAITSNNIDFLGQDHILTHDVIPMMEDGPQFERGHSARVAEYGTLISDTLGFGPREKILKFLADIAHDRGKLKFRDCYSELRTNPAARERMKSGHVAPENIALEYGPIVASAIEQHHRHQKTLSSPYPEHLRLRQTPESLLLSQLIAIPDSWDALTSRPSVRTGTMRTYDEAVGLLMQEYADMRVKYDGSMFPTIDSIGEEIINGFLRAFEKLQEE